MPGRCGGARKRPTHHAVGSLELVCDLDFASVCRRARKPATHKHKKPQHKTSRFSLGDAGRGWVGGGGAVAHACVCMCVVGVGADDPAPYAPWATWARLLSWQERLGLNSGHHSTGLGARHGGPSIQALAARVPKSSLKRSLAFLARSANLTGMMEDGVVDGVEAAPKVAASNEGGA